MRYMTKEWYETMQRTDLHLLLRVSKKAETFSEDYFKALYARKEKEWLKLQKEVSEVEFEDIFPEDIEELIALSDAGDGTENGKYPNEAELAEAKENYLKMRESTREIFANAEKEEFDPIQERKNFKRMMRANIEMLQNRLPAEILQKVADIRVLALDVASREVKQEIAQFCKQNQKTVQQTMNAYQKQFNKAFKDAAPSWVYELSLHDCQVLSCRKKGNDLVLTLDNSGGFTDISRIRLKNCTVLRQDAPLHGAWCLYEEIYKTDRNGQYEIHFLLDKNQLLDFIVLADDVLCQHDRNDAPDSEIG